MKPPALYAVIVVLAALVVWLASALVHVENERYALQIGLCQHDPTALKMFDCLKKAQTRNGWYWHLWYALGD
ncbi:MAG: hypothetical protein EOP82_27355 [Variovorax sp.]|nr:MAG: hypothetical protein EOP82_27355 [Variovorax sp.]